VDGNLEIAPSAPKGIVWMGVNDVTNEQDVAAGFKTEIAFIIRHAKSYKEQRPSSRVYKGTVP
jgi:hypothetical protein